MCSPSTEAAPPASESKKVKIGSAKLKQSTFFCDQVESCVGDSVFYVDSAADGGAPHVPCQASVSESDRTKPEANERDTSVMLPGSELSEGEVVLPVVGKSPENTVSFADNVARKNLPEVVEQSRSPGKMTPLRERRTAGLLPLTNLTIDQGPQLSSQTMSSETNEVVDLKSSDLKSKDIENTVDVGTTEVCRVTLSQTPQMSLTVSGPCQPPFNESIVTITSPVVSPADEVKRIVSPLLGVLDNASIASATSTVGSDRQEHSPESLIASTSLIDQPTESGDVKTIEEAVTVLSATPQDYSARDDYKIVDRKETRKCGVAKTAVSPAKGKFAALKSLQMEIASTLQKNKEVIQQSGTLLPQHDDWSGPSSLNFPSSISGTSNKDDQPGPVGRQGECNVCSSLYLRVSISLYIFPWRGSAFLLL